MIWFTRNYVGEVMDVKEMELEAGNWRSYIVLLIQLEIAESVYTIMLMFRIRRSIGI